MSQNDTDNKQRRSSLQAMPGGLRLLLLLGLVLSFAVQPGLAAEPGSFTTTTETVGFVGDEGWTTSLAINKNDTPTISYYDATTWF